MHFCLLTIIAQDDIYMSYSGNYMMSINSKVLGWSCPDENGCKTAVQHNDESSSPYTPRPRSDGWDVIRQNKCGLTASS